MKKIYLALFFIVFLLAGSPSVYAGIRLDKPKIRLDVAPGGHVSDEIKIENNGKEPLEVRAYLEDWVYKSQDGGKEFMPKGTTPLSCANWINFNPMDFKIPPGGEQIVRFTLSVPEDAKGSHFAVLFFEVGGGNMPAVDQQGNNISVKVYNRLGALFYVNPEGTVAKKAEMKNLNLSQNMNKLSVTADFLNTGNADLAGKGTFDVFNSEGFVFLRGAFPDFYTLPGEKARLSAKASNANLKPGTYDILLTLEYETGGNLVQEAAFQVGEDGSISGVTLKEG
jgi:P pilus assembly chaperone PapD